MDVLSINDDNDFLSVMSEIEDPRDRSDFRGSRNAVMALNKDASKVMDVRMISDFLIFASKIAKEADLPHMSRFLSDISKKKQYASKPVTTVNLRESKGPYSEVRYVMKTIKSRD